MLRRGFKSEANWIARDVRASLMLQPESPLCPFELAEHLEIPVHEIQEFRAEAPMAIAYFGSNDRQAEFSAVTLHIGARRVIVHNGFHHPKRQAANVAHELAHALLHHPAAAPLNGSGELAYEAGLEAEANWLGPAILVSYEAAIWIVEQDMSEKDASDWFRVSQAVIRMRVGATGARARVDARRRKAA